MKTYLTIVVLFITAQVSFGLAAKTEIFSSPSDTLQTYTGRYEQNKGGVITQVDVEVENGQLVATSLLDGRQMHLDNTGGNYSIKELGAPVKFIKDKSNNVTGILLAGTDQWTKVDITQPPHGVNPNQQEYVGKYRLLLNGQAMVIQITIKHGKLWGIPLFGGPESPLEYLSGDDYNINTANWPLKFIRDKDSKVSQLLFNSKDLFTRVK